MGEVKSNSSLPSTVWQPGAILQSNSNLACWAFGKQFGSLHGVWCKFCSPLLGNARILGEPVVALCPFVWICMICGHVVQFQDMPPKWLPISIPWIKSHHIPDILQSSNTLLAAAVEWRSCMYSTSHPDVFQIRCIPHQMYSTSHSIPIGGIQFSPLGCRGRGKGMRGWKLRNIFWYLQQTHSSMCP